MNAARRIPWTVEWSCALFVGIALFTTIVHVASRPMAEIAADWPEPALLCALYGGIAVAVLRGASWIRPLFIGVALLGIVSLFTPHACMIVRTTPEAWDHAIDEMTAIAAALCFIPPSNRYFSDRKRCRPA